MEALGSVVGHAITVGIGRITGSSPQGRLGFQSISIRSIRRLVRNAETISKQDRTATFRTAGAPRMQWTLRERKMGLYHQNNCCDDSARLMDWVFLPQVNVIERVRTLLFADLPALKDCLRLYDPSIAASNERMVSNGRSRRGRVGLDRSGSTRLETLFRPSLRVKRPAQGVAYQ